ncbi:MAG: hypothetical protein EXS03_06385 [Phycisphaerales bacterium]|nr:hypothetical protein [Phycisphaerales bacterium]
MGTGNGQRIRQRPEAGLSPQGESSISEPEGGTGCQAQGLGTAAASGTAWSVIQIAVNKVGTIISIWLVAQLLSPDEFGMAALTVSVGLFLSILPPLTVGDVIVTHTTRFEPIARAAMRLANLVGIGTFILTAIAAPIVAWCYGEPMLGVFVGLLLVVALRPVSFGLVAVPLARLRVAFDYRSIALIDGWTQLGATTLVVVLAYVGCGPLALVLPQVAVTFVRAYYYRQRTRRIAIAVERPPSPVPECSREEHRRLIGQFALAGIAQYVHNTLVILPVLVLGYFASEHATGLFAFAFSLSTQANGLIAAQLGTVLQPIFVGLGHATERQVAGFLRVVRVLGAGAVPICLLQAALAEPLFRLLLEPKWDEAIPVFAVLSLLESSYFATAPTMALLRAQSRFKTYFVWQVLQFVIAAGAFVAVAPAYGALGVASCSAILWMTSLPIAVWLCTRPMGGSIWQGIGIFVVPWATAVPVAGGAWYAWTLLEPLGTPGMILALLVVGPAALAVSLWLTRFTQPSAYAEIASIATRYARKLLKR